MDKQREMERNTLSFFYKNRCAQFHILISIFTDVNFESDWRENEPTVFTLLCIKWEFYISSYDIQRSQYGHSNTQCVLLHDILGQSHDD